MVHSIPKRILKGTKKYLFKSKDTLWVSGTQVANYLLKEPMIDWLSYYHSTLGLNNTRVLRRRTTKESKESTKPTSSHSPTSNVLMKNGLAFEDKIYKDLLEKFYGYIVKLEGGVSKEAYERTMEEIKKKTPIILQASIKSDELKLRGVVDILVHSDYINRLTRTPVTVDTTIEPHYLVIDIKWSHMALCVDGKTIRNEGRFKAYKGQLLIYNTIIGEIQGYTPTCTYVMSKSWNIDKKGAEKEGYSCYDVLGVVDYAVKDEAYVDNTIDGINWIRNMRLNGSAWSPMYPHIPEMCCNASNMDEQWSDIKKTILNHTEDITKVWMLSPEHRNRAFKNKVRSWTHKKCTVDMLGLSDGKRKEVIHKILSINQQSKDIIRPNKLSDIKDNRFNWKKKYPTDFFIDYETICESFMKLEDRINIHNSKLISGYIFMIGVGYVDSNNEFIFKVFRCNSFSLSEELRIIKEFQKYIEDTKKRIDPEDEYPVRMFHWAHVERTLLETAFERHSQGLTQRPATIWPRYDEIRWIDLCDVFMSSPIVVRGALCFKLKEVARALHKAGCIKTLWEDSALSNGMVAMKEAIEYYTSISSTKNIMKGIEKYNMIDCKVLWEIIEYVRSLL